jgi:nicotinate phosphoribosyltransferase
VWRRYGADGRMTGDLLGLEDSRDDGEPLLQPVMKNGRRLEASPPIEQVRQRVKCGLERLLEPLQRLDTGTTYPVEVAAELKELAEEVDRRMR